MSFDPKFTNDRYGKFNPHLFDDLNKPLEKSAMFDRALFDNISKPKDEQYNYIKLEIDSLAKNYILDQKFSMNNSFQNLFKDIIKNTNIAPTQGQNLSERAAHVSVLCFEPTKPDSPIENKAGALMIENFTEFARQYAPGTFFPIIYDVSQPDRIYFGVGNDSRFANGTPVPEAFTLSRNGGHFELAVRHRQQSMPDMGGLFGGGISLDALGNLEVSFKSRSVNGSNGVPDGELPAQVFDTLRTIVGTLVERGNQLHGARQQIFANV